MHINPILCIQLSPGACKFGCRAMLDFAKEQAWPRLISPDIVAIQVRIDLQVASCAQGIVEIYTAFE
jgi:hypothetical protein